MKKIFVLIACILILSGCSSTDNAAPAATATSDPGSEEQAPPAGDSNQGDGQAAWDVQPVGFAVQRTCQKNDPCLANGESYPDGSELVLVPAAGETPFSIYLPGLGDVVHIASPVDFALPEGTIYIFREYENNQFEMISNGELINSFDGNNCRLIGAPGQQVFALSYLPGSTDSGMSEISVFPGVGAMVTAPGPEYLVLPVAVHGNGLLPPENEYVEMWYTLEPYGIGGDILYPPYNGLFYLQGNGEVQDEILPQNLQFSALSPDTRLAAYTQPPAGSLSLRDVASGVDVVIPLLESSERGAGSAVFSPDSQKVAWLEASGSLWDGNFSPTIRIAGVNGEILAQFSAEALQEVSGFPNMIVRPVGWIDNQRVLLQVYVTRDYGDKVLLIANTDGTIEDSVITGTFISLIFGE